MVLECLETSKGSASSDHLMAEAGLVLLEVVVVVDLLVVVLAAVSQEVSNLVYCVLCVQTSLTPEAHCGCVCWGVCFKELV